MRAQDFGRILPGREYRNLFISVLRGAGPGKTFSVATERFTERAGAGFGWGIVATLAMSAFMVGGVTTGIAPMPEPIPKAIVGKILGAAPPPLILAGAVASHLLYGGIFGALLAMFVRPVTWWKGVLLGTGLWILMGLVWLPFLGWGPFGVSVDPKIAGATLMLHLVYGVTLGLLLDRPGHRATQAA